MERAPVILPDDASVQRAIFSAEANIRPAFRGGAIPVIKEDTMTTREFIQHLILNGELDDQIRFEIKLPDDPHSRYLSYEPAHVVRLGEEVGSVETLVECKPPKEE